MFHLVLFNFAAGIWSAAVTAHLRPRPHRLMPLATVAVYLLTVQAWVYFTGWFGALNLETWRAVATLLLLGSVYLLAGRIAKREMLVWWKSLRVIVGQLGGATIALTAAFTFAAMMILGAAGWWVGPYLPDVIHYHLAGPADWIAEGRISGRDWPDPRSWWPSGQGLLALFHMLPTGTIRAASWANLPVLMLTMAGGWAWVRQWGGSRRVALAGAAAMLGIPVVWAQSTAAMNDLTVAALLMAALAPLLGPSVTPAAGNLSLLALCLLIGVKGVAWLLAPPVALLLLYRVYRNRWQFQITRAWRVLLALALFIGATWYIRNAVFWSNPLYPSPLTIGWIDVARGDELLGGEVGRISFSQFRRTLGDLLSTRIWDRQAIHRGDVADGSGFGPAAAGLGLVAILFLTIANSATRPAAVCLLAMLLPACAGIRNDPWFARFFAIFALILTAAAVVMIDHLPDRRMKLAWSGMLGIALACGLWSGLQAAIPPLARLHWQDRGLAPIPPASLALFAQFTSTLHAIEKFDSAAPPGFDAPLVVYAPHRTAPVAALHGPQLARRLIYATQPPDAALLARWQAAGARYLIAVTPASSRQETDRQLHALGLIPRLEQIHELPR